jgi:hypothetical protein
MVFIFAIWLYITTLAYELDDVILMYIQFFVALPLVILLLADIWLKGISVGTGVGIGLLTASIYFVFLGTSISLYGKRTIK